MQIIRLFHQCRRHGGVDLRRRQPLVPHLLLNHGHRHACHQRIYHMAVPEDMGCDLLPGELLPGRNLLDPGLFCQAALKAANRGYTDIKLRERGTKKVHVFTGEMVQVDKPKGAPAWMPDKIWTPIVKKVGTETLE